jgi:hypothetical protein
MPAMTGAGNPLVVGVENGGVGQGSPEPGDPVLVVVGGRGRQCVQGQLFYRVNV